MEITKNWFAETAPLNAKKASVNVGIGTEPDANIILEYNKIGTEGNAYSLQFVKGVGNNIELSAALVGKVVKLTLGTDGAGVLDTSKNTVAQAVTLLNAVEGFGAVYDGIEETVITVEGDASDAWALTGGQFGTPCPVPYTVVKDANYYYTNIAPNTEHDANWRRFQLVNY